MLSEAVIRESRPVDVQRLRRCQFIFYYFQEQMVKTAMDREAIATMKTAIYPRVLVWLVKVARIPLVLWLLLKRVRQGQAESWRAFFGSYVKPYLYLRLVRIVLKVLVCLLDCHI